MKIEKRPDGTRVVKLSPMRGVPFYSDWLQILLARGAAFEMTEPGGKVVIKPLDRHQEQRTVHSETEGVGVVCIGCGMPIYGEIHESFKDSRTKRKRFDKIKIGGFIQVQVEEMIAPKNIEVSWKMRPVTKEGIGCRNCRRLFEAEQRRVNELNLLRESYANILASILEEGNKPEPPKEPIEKRPYVRCKHGLPAEEFCAVCLRDKGISYLATGVKLPEKVQAFLDVFPRDMADRKSEG